MNEPLFNIAAIKRCVRSEGPHERMAVWFQGCDIRCEGCCNPDFIPFIVRNKVPLSGLLDIVRESKEQYAIEGVTLLGGEPTLQSGLSLFCGEVRKMGLGVILFTGHTFESLPGEIVENVDLIVDGRFERDKPDMERNMIGSSNQRIIDISGRYKGDMGWFTDKREKRIEISLDGDELNINGDFLPLGKTI